MPAADNPQCSIWTYISISDFASAVNIVQRLRSCINAAESTQILPVRAYLSHCHDYLHAVAFTTVMETWCGWRCMEHISQGRSSKSAPLVLAAMVASRPTCEKITKRQLPASTPTSLLATCSAYRCLCVLFNLCSIDRPHAASIPISYGRHVIDFIRIRSCSLWEGKLVWSYEVSAGSQGKPSTVWLWN